ncbi:MAG: helix-turn-helix domain-containing protein [Candidatus Obscuribacterales bacterium]|nr:helix-turn-helix domain-containing protein [Candidatus Obscuribacterales bacterium]
MSTHDEHMQKLSPSRRAKIEARANELIADEMTLRDVRKAREFSQETLAEVLGWRQGDLSKFERRADAYLSTIRRYVEAMGGTLDLVATFPNKPPVKIVNIGDLSDGDDTAQEEQQELHLSKVVKRV